MLGQADTLEWAFEEEAAKPKREPIRFEPWVEDWMGVGGLLASDREYHNAGPPGGGVSFCFIEGWFPGVLDESSQVCVSLS